MAYFLPQFFQKRLLKYALSRLELVDTDALDLDSLGITWGQRSTFELRDVGLRLEKLSSILRLPRSFDLIKARILLLRVTIPADIYSSGIVVEVEGVDIQVRLLSEETLKSWDSQKDAQKNRGKCGLPRGVKSNRPRSSPPAVHDPGGSPNRPGWREDDEEHILPSTADLAQSFLQSEPRRERAELQAAIASQSQYLQQSIALSDDAEDELGTGTQDGVSLPSFIAGFFKGIGDRLQIKIKHVVLNVNAEIPSDGVAKRQSAKKSDTITAQLTIHSLEVEGVTTSSVPERSRVGKRLMSLHQVRAMLISDPSVFSNYSRFSVPVSPIATQSKPSRTPGGGLSPHSGSSASSTGLAMTYSTILEPPARILKSPPPPEALVYTDDGQFSDAGTEAEREAALFNSQAQGNQESHYEDSVLDNPSYLDEVISSQFDDRDIEDSATLSSGLMLPSAPCVDSRSRHLSQQSSPLPGGADSEIPVSSDTADPLSDFSQHSEHDPNQTYGSIDNRSMAEMRSQHRLSCSPDQFKQESEPGMGSSGLYRELNDSENIDSQDRPREDLTESKIFTHEEAESMYMSAVSHAFDTKSEHQEIPGAWYSPPTKRSHMLVSHESLIVSPLPVTSIQQGETADDERRSTPRPVFHASSPAENDPSQGDVKHAGSRDSPVQISKEFVDEDQEVARSNISDGLSPLAKEVLSIDRISIWLPSKDRDSKIPPEDAPRLIMTTDASDSMLSSESISESQLHLGVSTAIEAPSMPRRPARDSLRTSASPNRAEPRSSRRSGSDQATDTHDDLSPSETLEVLISSISSQFDLSIGRIFMKMFQGFMAALATEKPHETEKPPNEVKPAPAVKVDVQDISLRFLEHLSGSTIPLQSAPHLFFSRDWSAGENDVLLRAKLSGLGFSMSNVSGISMTRLDISKFCFGHSKGDILAFDAGLKMRDSTRDLMSAIPGDVSILVKSSDEASYINITSLPIHLSLDIQRLDEVFSWFGGLSGILELGSSMSSMSTVVGGSPKPKKPSTRPRGVRFEPIAAEDSIMDQGSGGNGKTNVRVGGLVIDLTGKLCYMRLETTAMKLVSRSEGIGLQIDKAKLTGPHLIHAAREPAVKVDLGNLRIEYLFTPKETDLDRLLSLLTPSKDKYDQDDDIMLDTLFRQRRQGAVLRVTIASLKSTLSKLADLEYLPKLAAEMTKLSTVAKYLPEDDRPGILTLALIKDFDAQVNVGGAIGTVELASQVIEAAHVNIPSLVAAKVATIALRRNSEEELVGEVLASDKTYGPPASPMIMARFIADEMDPTIKIKLCNIRVEYQVPAIMAFMGLKGDLTAEEVAVNMVSSVINLTDQTEVKLAPPKLPSQSSTSSESSISLPKTLKVAVVMRDFVVGLNPRDLPSKGLVVLTDARFLGSLLKDDVSEATMEIKKASILITDDIQKLGSTDYTARKSPNDNQSDQVQELSRLGFVPVSYISSAMAVIKVMQLDENLEKSLDVELRDDLLILETCADSTQTLLSILNGLKPPMPPSQVLKYRTEVMPIQDMLASLSGDAFISEPLSGSEGSVLPPKVDVEDSTDEESPQDLEYVSGHIKPQSEGSDEDLSASMLEYDMPASPTRSSLGRAKTQPLLESFNPQSQAAASVMELDFQDDHFAIKSSVGGTAHRWNSAHNTYGLTNEVKLRGSPLRVRVRDVHVIWNLFDGYDWQRTRETISKAVKDVETRATERRARTGRGLSPGAEDEEESVIGDFLFNSIYIGIPANRDPRELAQDINRNLDDLTSETGSYATSTTVTGSPSRQGQTPRVRGKKLRLTRSKHHKLTFELKGISADLVVFPPGSGETQSSCDVRVEDLEIFDHVPTSTWKKFATYMYDAGERESGTSMVHLEILSVKPIAELAASELVLKVTVLPLRLHVDQDALDFMSRFFEFKDESVPIHASKADVPFLQRVEVNAVRLKLDFKPKRVDYGGLRSGRTTEFMNFFVLDQADMVLRKVIIYGVSGFDKLGKTLNDIWMPDIKRNQLPGVLAGLAPIRSLVNVGSGVKDLVVVPMREYKKDGRVVRSIQKGALAFAKTTTTELVKLGAKLAIGTQTVLQGAEDFLNKPGGYPSDIHHWEDAELDEDEKKQISLYADQPVGVVSGLRGAYASLERDLLMARDAIVAVPGEVLESGSAGGAAKAVLKRAPTVILRPAIGASKAVGQTLLGAGNSLDPGNRRRVEDKYKRH